jgi:transcriptional regulator with XRE-family HTH domain
MKSTFSENYQRVIEELIAARKQRGVLQTAIATALGKPQSFVSKVEGRERRIDVVEFIEICRAIGVSPVEILRQAGVLTERD